MRRIRLLILLLLFTPTVLGETPAKDLKSKDVQVRLATVARILEERPEDGEELLLTALKDRDWEVVENAAAALGEIGGEDSVTPLLTLALTGPVRRVRFAAADSLILIGPDPVIDRIVKQTGGQVALAAFEALSRYGAKAGEERLTAAIARGFSAKDVPVKVAAARLVGALDGRRRREVLAAIFRMPETTVQAAALDAIRITPDEDDVTPLLALMHRKELNDVLSRRTLAAILAVVLTAKPGEDRDRLGRKALVGSELAKTPEAAARFARLAGILGKLPPQPEFVPGEAAPPAAVPPPVSFERVLPTLEFALKHNSEEARAAAVFALGEIAQDAALDRALALAEKDGSARVRLHALRTLVRVRGVKERKTRDLARRLLLSDPDESVREYAAVALGAKGLDDVAADLARALKDKVWQVAVCAAVSLGKTEDPAGVDPLIDLAGARDWKLRGAAIVGLGHVKSIAAVPTVIEALASRDAPVARSAYGFLKRMTVKSIPPDPRAWTDWWNKAKPGYSFPDLEKEAKEAKKYGYATTYRGVYEDLDVIVLQSRGDTIEKLLEHLTISHRLTRSGQVPDAGLHPFAVFVANCTGEITPKDVEQLAWFVRVGGYLFGSCWALSETIELVYPGVVRKLPIPHQVLANVIAEPCRTESPYLAGVFPGMVQPIYVLYGAHLIDVMDPERVEVLIDSPQCAEEFTEGNLACWFDAGHGVILDSANHFDLQGLARAEKLKTAEDRMAYSIDHLGIDYEEARQLAAKRVWSSQTKALAEARDLSAFRFITNFVRHKRKVDR
jgi:HEAT repeat protein